MTHPLIAREGWLVLLAAFAAALIATWLIGWWSIPFWIWAVFALQFFRDPARVPPADADAAQIRKSQAFKLSSSISV